ncbi:MAG: Glycosyl transferase family 2 [Microgenomates group bacterium GW2011_GWC1_39_7b]|uniref:Glycosyl transferase family 2 n=3 Tax=Candidatus Woeseibacteriota TaxID=1752722 RepID=A0A0G0LIY7_9BACT|nr:MAG: Glycosyl transferase family 2 [Candidatus Woesebacteria bacterium GW2011_GWB1_39_10]KKR27044.1 MAG: Glycosyl transferase family 2 [Microgenomates group bacterium GW2011_GWC1_39_7b]KKR74126.1 MAG: Glycosyl transferase family 2 [Candidatus Woesebacteria bacterium GW2011_GWA2_40_7]KKS90853.1 MAG: Glycosyl transferase family 2 [Candidatus Woesebacteria bacterium GW2011_GWA1_43_12]
MASKISVVINTLNEEENLPRAIASINGFADEIVVVDMESTDKTVEVSKKLGAKVFFHKKMGYVEPGRNFAISKASNPWILVLDADEEVTQGLSLQIQKILKNPKADYYRIPRKNIIFGKWLKHSRWWPDYNIRLFKKGSVSWNEVIHAVPMTQGIGAELESEEELAIVHHNYDTVEQYIERMNRYTSQHALLRINEGYEFSWKDVITKPSNEFFSRYFFGEGYKDGLHGLALSFLQAFSELVMYLKIWQKEKFAEKDLTISEVNLLMRDEEKELHYWQGDSQFKESGKLADRIRRKFKI